MNVNLEEAGLRDLLVAEAEKERRAYKRKALSIGVVGLMGLIWIAISAYSVVRLKRQSDALNVKVETQRGQVEHAEQEYHRIRASVERANTDLGRAQKQLDEIKAQTTTQTNSLTKLQQSLAAASQAFEQDAQLGFITSEQSNLVTYRGKDRETIYVNVHYIGAQESDSTATTAELVPTA
jgi:chromosome segregation ATPase